MPPPAGDAGSSSVRQADDAHATVASLQGGGVRGKDQE
jgi:hypothetical protein